MKENSESKSIETISNRSTSLEIQKNLELNNEQKKQQQEEKEEEEEEEDQEDILVYSHSHLGSNDRLDTIGLLNNSTPKSPSQFSSSSNSRSRHTHNRVPSTNSFSFNFSTHLLPLGQSLETVRHSTPHLSPLSAIALIVSYQIGSGIFSSPGILSQNCGSPGASLIVWILAGTLAWTGASSFAELGAAIPVNGGAQAYLNYSFGGWASYLFIWTNLVALKPGSAAIISIVASEYLCRIFYHTAWKPSPSESALMIPQIVIKIVAIIIAFIISGVNGFSVKAGNRIPIILTILKLISLVSIIIMALVRLAMGTQSDNFQPHNIFNHTSHSPSDYASALYSGLWAFDGWDSGNYVAGELKKASKNLPTVIHSSMGIVLTLILLTNWAYLIVLPLQVVSQSNTIGLEFGRAIFGPIGGFIFSFIVAISCFGALNSAIFTTARITSVAAEERFIPHVFSHINEKTSTPVNALGLNAFLIVIMIGFGDFKSLVGFYGTCSWTFYLLTVGSLLLLRIREPDLDRPYQTWLINPITFSTVALFLLLMPIFSAPFQSLAAFGFIISGLPFYYLTTNINSAFTWEEIKLSKFKFKNFKNWISKSSSHSNNHNDNRAFKALNNPDEDDDE